jgi:hypothetical protein
VNWQDFSQATRIIDLSGNALESIPDDFFESLPQLEVFIACGNGLTSLPASVVKSNIIVLNISDNPISLPSAFQPSLEQLFCSHCGLSSLPDSLSENPELISLVASSNCLATVPDLPHIETLNLSRNRLTAVPRLSSRVQFLDLSCNQIAELPNPLSYPMLITLDLSHNRLETWPAQALFPSLFSLKLSHNPLNGRLLLDSFPNIRTISVVETGAEIEGSISKIRVFFSPESQVKGAVWRMVHEGEGSAVAQHRSGRELCEDVAIVRSDGRVFGIFDGHNGGKVPEIMAGDFAKNCSKKLEEQVILGLIEDRLRVLKHSKLIDLSSCAVVWRKRHEILYMQNGNIRILFISEDGEVKVLETERLTKCEYSHDIEFQNLGTWMVYGRRYEPALKRKKLPQRAKWMVIASHGVLDVVSPKLMSAIAAKAESAVALAYDLRSAAYAHMTHDNISVIAVDLTV